MPKDTMISRAMHNTFVQEAFASDAAKRATDITSSSMPQLPGDCRTVPVMAGDKVFQVDKTLLVKSSKFLQAAMKDEWRTDNSKPIHVIDTKASVFNMYLDWLLSGKAPGTSDTDNMRYKDLAELYILGEKLIDAPFQNTLMASIIESLKTGALTPDMESIKVMYNGTPDSSPGRRISVDKCAWDMDWRAQCLEDLDPEQDAEFYVDLLRAMAQCRPCVSWGYSRPWILQLRPYMVTQGGKAISIEEERSLTIE